MRQTQADTSTRWAVNAGGQLATSLQRPWLAWLAASERRQLRRVALWDPQSLRAPAEARPGEDCS